MCTIRAVRPPCKSETALICAPLCRAASTSFVDPKVEAVVTKWQRNENREGLQLVFDALPHEQADHTASNMYRPKRAPAHNSRAFCFCCSSLFKTDFANFPLSPLSGGCFIVPAILTLLTSASSAHPTLISRTQKIVCDCFLEKVDLGMLIDQTFKYCDCCLN